VTPRVLRALAIVLGLFGIYAVVPGLASGPHYDFNAFRCAGEILRLGGDPYLQRTMLACQAAAQTTLASANVAVPAPQPPPILALFVVLSLVPSAAGWIVWSCALLAATVLAVVWISAATQTRWTTVAAALAIVAWLPGAWVGAASPLALAGVAGAMLAARGGRWPLVALGLTVAAIQPNLAAAAWIGALVLLPKTRVWLAGAFVILVAIGTATTGLAGWREWIERVVPAHQVSEAHAFAQLGWTTVFASLPIPVRVAMAIATVLWLLAIATSLWLAARERDPVRALAYPLAASVALAPFLHVGEVAFAVPALLVMERTPLVKAALLLLSAPWFSAYSVTELQPFVIAGTVWLAADLEIMPIAVVLGCALEWLLCVRIHIAVLDAYHLTIDALRDDIAAQANRLPNALAEESWGRYQLLQQNPLLGYLVKAPSMAGTLLTFALQTLPMKAARTARRVGTR